MGCRDRNVRRRQLAGNQHISSRYRKSSHTCDCPHRVEGVSRAVLELKSDGTAVQIPGEVHGRNASCVSSRKERRSHCKFHLRIGNRKRRSGKEDLCELHFDVCEGIRGVRKLRPGNPVLISRLEDQQRRDSTREGYNGADYVPGEILDDLTWLLSESRSSF